MSRLLLLLLMVFSPSVSAKDYGLGHAVVNYFAGEVISEINEKLFPPKVANWVTRVELFYMAHHWCYREADARGTWDVSLWDSDSLGDCISPVFASGYQLQKHGNGVVIPLFEYRW